MTDNQRTASMTATATGTCPVCQKTNVKRTKTVHRDLNGVDVNDVVVEMSRELDAWQPEFTHMACRKNRVPYLGRLDGVSHDTLVNSVEKMIRDKETSRADLFAAETYLHPGADDDVIDRLYQRIASTDDLPHIVTRVDVRTDAIEVVIDVDADIQATRDELERIVEAFGGCDRDVTFWALVRTEHGSAGSRLDLGNRDGKYRATGGRIIRNDAIVTRLLHLLND